ncbi:MAG: N-acetylglucosamine-6-phosphate deacetylase [Chthoniobacterales bacterium]
MADLFLANAQIVTPKEVIQGNILCENGKISDFGPQVEKPRSDTIPVFDAKGRRILPGYIDIHSHGADGVDTSEATPEQSAADSVISKIAKKKLAEGVTTWLPTTTTISAAKLEKIAAGIQNYRNAPTATRVPGMHIEGPFLSKKFLGSQNPLYAIEPDFDLVKRLHDICPARLLSLAVELPGALSVIEKCKDLGIVTSCAHSGATYAEFKKAQAAGIQHITHYCNQISPLHHREIGLVGAGMLDSDVKVEIICDGLHLNEDMLRLVFKTIPPERIMLITDSIAASWLGDGFYELGEQEVEVRNGSAYVTGTTTLAGTTLHFDHGVERAARISGFTVPEISRIASTNQAQSLGLSDRGAIQKGLLADFVVVGESFHAEQTILGAEIVS